jgi:hypothetical protein
LSNIVEYYLMNFNFKTTSILSISICLLAGLAAFAFAAPAGAASSAAVSAATDRFVGTYRREFVGPSGNSVEILDLRADLTASLTGSYQARGGMTMEGSWTRARGRVIVSFPPADIDGSAVVMEFQRTGGFLFFTSGGNLKLSSVNPSNFARTGTVYERIRRP